MSSPSSRPEPLPPLAAHVAGLRRRHGRTRAALAERAGIEETLLAALEAGSVARLSNELVLALADALELRDLYERLQLRRMNTQPLRFKAYKVGLIATGGHAMALLFSRHRTGHEFHEETLMRWIEQRRAGVLDEATLVRRLRRRDCLGAFELETSAASHHLTALLARTIPFARFVFTIRDPLSWADGVLDWLLGSMPAFVPPHGELLFGFAAERLRPEGIEADLPRIAETLLAFWARENRRILDELPAGRSLLVRTHELVDSCGPLARFLGLDPATLRPETGRRFRRFPARRLIARLPERTLLALVATHGPDLSARLFPGYAVADFLAGRVPPRADVAVEVA